MRGSFLSFIILSQFIKWQRESGGAREDDGNDGVTASLSSTVPSFWLLQSAVLVSVWGQTHTLSTSQGNRQSLLQGATCLYFTDETKYSCTYGLNCVPPNPHVAVLTSRTSECECICRWIFEDAIKLKWGPWCGPECNMTDVLTRIGDLEIARMCVHWEKAMWGHGEKVATCIPWTEASEETNSDATLLSDFQPPELWEYSVV